MKLLQEKTDVLGKACQPTEKHSDLIQDRNNLLIFPDDRAKELEILEFMKSQFGFSQKEGEKRARNFQSTPAT